MLFLNFEAKHTSNLINTYAYFAINNNSLRLTLMSGEHHGWKKEKHHRRGDRGEYQEDKRNRRDRKRYEHDHYQQQN